MDELSQRQQALLQKVEKLGTFDWFVIEAFLKDKFDVPDMQFLKPFGERRAAFSLMRNVELGVQVGSVGQAPLPVTFQGPDPKSCRLNPTEPTCVFLNSPTPAGDPVLRPDTKQPLPWDLDDIACYSISCSHAWSSFVLYIAARINFRHKGMEELYETKETDAIYKAAGGIEGAFMTIKNTPATGVELRDCFPFVKQKYGYLNEQFVATMALINQNNIKHGIFALPADLCKKARMVVYEGVPEPPQGEMERMLNGMGASPSDASAVAQARERLQQNWREAQVEKQGVDTFAECKFNEYFIAVPVNHVLAWPLKSERFVEEHGFRAYQFRVLYPGAAESEVLYYFIGNADFDVLFNFFCSTWIDKVDHRPLSQIGFEFVPMYGMPEYPEALKNASAFSGLIALRSYLTYMVHPRMPQATIDNLAPMLHPNFPPPHEWCDNLLAAAIMQDHQESIRRK